MTAFHVFKQFDSPDATGVLERRIYLRPSHAKHFAGDDLPSRFARALCEERAINLKELLEAFEFFQAVRRYAAAPRIADLCSGHGLVGVLFALFERKVENVTLVDRRKPMSYDKILAAADRIGPWVREKLTFREVTLERVEEAADTDLLSPGTSLIAVHACGMRTDRVIALAIRLRGALACLPCCRPHRMHPAPAVLKRELGGDLAIDVHRTYELERAGYLVRWKAIPAVISPMNRILIGSLPASRTPDPLRTSRHG